MSLGTLTVAGCELVKQDTASASDPVPLWGAIECATSARHQRPTSGGDTHTNAFGQPQGNSAFRRLTVIDGDDFSGERCELGRNEHRYGLDGSNGGTFALYREGDRKVTFVSYRLPSSFPLSTTRWQTIMQMKQTQPSAGGGGGPVLEMQAYSGRYRLFHDWNEIWSAPATTGQWARFAFDVEYSQSPALGSIKVYADLNNDGDATDSGEQSPQISAATLKQEPEGGWPGDGIDPGESIPSHLRAGIYHDPLIVCKSPSGCATEIDNVQVIDVKSDSTPYAAAVQEDGPAGYWRFNETSGSNASPTVGSISGTHGSGATAGAASLGPQLGEAVDYNGGTNAQTTFGDSFDFTGTNAFSLEMWVRPDVVDGTYRRLVSKQSSSGGTQGYTVFSESPEAGLGFERWRDGAKDLVTCSALAPNTTYHVVATYNGSTMRLYKNGVECGSIASTRSLTDNTGAFLVGNTSIVTGRNFDGRIDEPAVYSKALSATEVSKHYQAGS